MLRASASTTFQRVDVVVLLGRNTRPPLLRKACFVRRPTKNNRQPTLISLFRGQSRSPLRRGNAHKIELAEHLVVGGHFSLSLEGLDLNLALVVRGRGEGLHVHAGCKPVPQGRPSRPFGSSSRDSKRERAINRKGSIDPAANHANVKKFSAFRVGVGGGGEGGREGGREGRGGWLRGGSVGQRYTFNKHSH